MKVLLIGGYPKGHDRPFHPATWSGKRLRQLVDGMGLDAEYLDLWTTPQEERKGKIDPVTIAIIKNGVKKGVVCIALGKWVHKRLSLQGITAQYLPHPASRRRSDLKKLERGLLSIKKREIKEWFAERGIKGNPRLAKPLKDITCGICGRKGPPATPLMNVCHRCYGLYQAAITPKVSLTGWPDTLLSFGGSGTYWQEENHEAVERWKNHLIRHGFIFKRGSWRRAEA